MDPTPTPPTSFPVTGIKAYVLSPIAGHHEPVIFEFMGQVDLTPPVSGDTVEFDPGDLGSEVESILHLFSVTPAIAADKFTVTRPKSITPDQWAILIAAIKSILAAFNVVPPVPADDADPEPKADDEEAESESASKPKKHGRKSKS